AREAPLRGVRERSEPRARAVRRRARDADLEGPRRSRDRGPQLRRAGGPARRMPADDRWNTRRERDARTGAARARVSRIVHVYVHVSRVTCTYTCTILVALALAACSTGDPGPGLDTGRELAHVAALTALGPRPAGSGAAKAAVAYIEHALAGVPLEVMVVGDVDLPAIEIGGTAFREARHVHVDDADLIARFGPPGKALLFMGHYDSMPSSPGAVDDAAAVAVLIELARELEAHPPAQPVMIAFTADEEHGLVGAESLVKHHGDEVELAIALDLIGSSGRISLNGASTRIGYAEMTWLARAADRAGVIVDAPLPHRVVSRWFP